MAQTIPTLVADFETNFAAPVSSGAISATLASATDDDGVALPNGVYAFTVDIGNSTKEYIICNLVGTSLSNIQSISRQGVLSTGFENAHRRGAVVAITDWAALSRIAGILRGTVGLDGSFPIKYDSVPTFTDPLQVPDLQYVLDHINGGPVSFDSETINGSSGEGLTQFDAVYFNAPSGQWFRTNASVLGKSVGVRLGVALATVTSGSNVPIMIHGSQFRGDLLGNSTFYLTNTPGQIDVTPGTNVVSIGVTDGNNNFYLGILPGSYQDALIGTNYIPSTTNPYVTKYGTSDGSSDQAQVAQDSSTPFGSANSTGNRYKISQSFVLGKSAIKSVDLYKAANTGTFTGNVLVSIQADVSGSPSGTALLTRTILNANYNAYPVGDFLVLFSTEYNGSIGTTYWIVAESSTGDAANHPNLGYQSTGGYASGGVKYNNTTDGWVSIPTIDLYFKVNQGFNGKAIDATSTGSMPSILVGQGSKNGVTANAAGNTIVVHGLGKIPRFIDAFLGVFGNGGNGSFANGTYDVGTSSYAAAFSSGASTGNTPYNPSTTSALLITGGSNGSGTTATFVVSAIDENVVIFNNSGSGFAGGNIVYKIVA